MNSDKTEEILNEIEYLMSEIPAVPQELLAAYLKRKLDLSEEDAYDAIELAENRYMLLLSPNHYLTTFRGLPLLNISKPRYTPGITYTLKNPIPVDDTLRWQIRALWVIAAYAKDISFFTFPPKGAVLAYCMDYTKRRCIEFFYFTRYDIYRKKELLRTLYYTEPADRPYVTRYLFIDNELNENEIPYLGFSKIFSAVKEGIYLKCERKESIWKDYSDKNE